MKLVDVYYYNRIQPLSEDELEEREELQRLQRQELTSKAATANRIKRENAAKLRDIKKFMFGNFISRSPILKAERHKDVPLPESQAVPYTPRPRPLAQLAMDEAGYRRTRLPGQHLEGDMIPVSCFPPSLCALAERPPPFPLIDLLLCLFCCEEGRVSCFYGCTTW